MSSSIDANQLRYNTFFSSDSDISSEEETPSISFPALNDAQVEAIMREALNILSPSDIDSEKN